MEFEWNIFPRFTTLQLCHKVQELLSRLSVTPEKLTGRIIFMSMVNDISWRSKENKQQSQLSAQLVSIYAKRLSQEGGHSSDLDQKRSGILLMKANHKENWTESAELMFKFGGSRHPVFRSTSPLSRGVFKSKGDGQLSIHSCADEGTIETVFRTSISVNQLSIYGAGSDWCEEYKACHVRTRETCFGGTI